MPKQWVGKGSRRLRASSSSKPAARATQIPARDPFLPGAIVVVTLGNPRDKFWGMILALRAEGLSLSGIELASFEDFVSMVKEGEAYTPAVVFFPMHRIERIELDLADGNLPSLSQRFVSQTGVDPANKLGFAGTGERSERASRTKMAQLSKDSV
jgi:hypothetical protein